MSPDTAATVRAEAVSRRLAFADDAAARVAVEFRLSEPIRGDGPAAGTRLRHVFEDASLAPAPGKVVLTLRKPGGPTANGAGAAGFEVIAAYPDPDGALAEYLSGLTALKAGDPVARAAYLSSKLETGGEAVAADAHGQFSAVPFAELARAADRLPPAERLRGWLRSRDVPAGRKGLYALMLSLRGGPADAAVIDETLPSVRDSAAGTGGLLAARCRLGAAADGLLIPLLRDARAPNAVREGAVRAAAFLLETADAARPETRAAPLAALRAALAEPMPFPYAVEELIRLREFSLTEDIKAAWADPKRGGSVGLWVVRYRKALPEREGRELSEWMAANPRKP
jgi:hypothetical protein